MKAIKRICVYCGSSAGSVPVYRDVAMELGRLMATQKIGLVYGGGKIGLMGALADAVMAAGGEAIGIIPHHLVALEVGHGALTSLIAVDSMHARKQQMAEMSDAFIALPGGIGTAEELLEVFTWLQLGLHAKPVALLNTKGFYNPLLDMFERMVTTGFLKEQHRSMLIVETSPEILLQRLKEFAPTFVAKISPAK